MNLIFHLPKTGKGQQELQKRVATVHAEVISYFLQKMDCSQEQKGKLLQRLEEHSQE